MGPPVLWLYTGPMSAQATKQRRVEVDLPAEAFSHHPWQPRQLAEELRLLWLLEQVRQRRLGFGKAAALAGTPVARFLELMRERNITPFDYDADELEQELR